MGAVLPHVSVLGEGLQLVHIDMVSALLGSISAYDVMGGRVVVGYYLATSKLLILSPSHAYVVALSDIGGPKSSWT